MKFGIKKYLYLRCHIKDIYYRDSNQGINIINKTIEMGMDFDKKTTKGILYSFITNGFVNIYI